ncbi:MAG: GNAT family N-acetyltransferase [Candidatus Promineifilaceae bacterium]|nr:GNAT family N-acetyltransferase [Candidatus Promineifilaceae bacterium]
MELIPACEFDMVDLADAYNETRIDYIIPMPMTVERLRNYIHVYDVDLACSCAAVRDGNILGIGMLGIRDDRGWVTRLGVLPSGRRQGVGRSIMEFLLDAAADKALPEVWLEVIEGNNPAHKLFLSLDFSRTRDLIVARRPPKFRALTPGEIVERPRVRHVRTLGREATLALLEKRGDSPNWLNQTESLHNVDSLSALVVETDDGGRGWVTYQTSLLQMTRIIVDVPEGDRAAVTAALLQTLHEFYPTQDAIAENIPADDPMWLGYQEAGYFEAFRRVEMVKTMAEPENPEG